MTLSDLVKFLKNLNKSKEKNSKIAIILLWILSAIGFGFITIAAILALINLQDNGVIIVGLFIMGFGVLIIIWASIDPVVKSWLKNEVLRKKNEELEVLLKAHENAKNHSKELEKPIINNILNLQNEIESIKKDMADKFYKNRQN